MGKSLRSKWKRKCRAIKRERYAVKELERLKKTLGIDENKAQDVEMAEISKIATVVDAKTIKESGKANNKAKADDEKMDIDTNKRTYNKKTMLDQYGNYPIWMNKRNIVKIKKSRAKNQKGNLKPHKRLTRRQRIAMKQK
ncbi:protein LLP homolog [Bombus pascuorum]|uniref:protein LLP homolog n=1 Tax=Bombus pascuorum TaxID=65598 RepID=UPI00213D7AEA|nr:protein LLP homolog [Bombus pascuorum]